MEFRQKLGKLMDPYPDEEIHPMLEFVDLIGSKDIDVTTDDATRLSCKTIALAFEKLDDTDNPDDIQSLYDKLHQISTKMPAINCIIKGAELILERYANLVGVKLKLENNNINMADIDAAAIALKKPDAVQGNLLVSELYNTGLLTENDMSKYLSDQKSEVTKTVRLLIETFQGEPLVDNDRGARSLLVPADIGIMEDQILEFGTYLLKEKPTSSSEAFQLLAWMNPDMEQVFSDFGHGNYTDNAFNASFCKFMYLLISGILDERKPSIEKTPYLKYLYSGFADAFVGNTNYKFGNLVALVITETIGCIEMEVFNKIGNITRSCLELLLREYGSLSLSPNDGNHSNIRMLFNGWLESVMDSNVFPTACWDYIRDYAKQTPGFFLCLSVAWDTVATKCSGDVTSTSHVSDNLESVVAVNTEGLSSLVNRLQVELDTSVELQNELPSKINRLIQENHNALLTASVRKDPAMFKSVVLEQGFLSHVGTQDANVANADWIMYSKRLAIGEYTKGDVGNIVKGFISRL